MSKAIFKHHQTGPKQFWTERLQRVFVNTQPIKHSGDDVQKDLARVLDNIAAAAHACNINKLRWTQECFASTEDVMQFLDRLREFKGHINSYWFYALIEIAEVEEDQASSSRLLANCLYEQAVRTKQLDGGAPNFQSPSNEKEPPVSSEVTAPVDFPREPALGSVSGVQPKLLLTKVEGKFLHEIDEEGVHHRWMVCEDLVQQLVVKTVKRMQEGRVDNLGDYVNKLQQWLEAQAWDGWKVTSAEARWMRDRIQRLVEERRAQE